MKKLLSTFLLFAVTLTLCADLPFTVIARESGEQYRQQRQSQSSVPRDPYGGTYIGRDSQHRPMYRGSRSGEYYVNPNNNRSYYTPPETYQKQNVQQGSRGGQYYQNRNGNKTYIRQR